MLSERSGPSLFRKRLERVISDDGQRGPNFDPLTSRQDPLMLLIHIRKAHGVKPWTMIVAARQRGPNSTMAWIDFDEKRRPFVKRLYELLHRPTTAKSSKARAPFACWYRLRSRLRSAFPYKLARFRDALRGS